MWWQPGVRNSLCQVVTTVGKRIGRHSVGELQYRNSRNLLNEVWDHSVLYKNYFNTQFFMLAHTALLTAHVLYPSLLIITALPDHALFLSSVIIPALPDHALFLSPVIIPALPAHAMCPSPLIIPALPAHAMCSPVL